MKNHYMEEFEKIISQTEDAPSIYDNAYDQETFDFNHEMQLIDKRYHAENVLLDAISIGDLPAAVKALYEYGNLMQSPLQKSFPTSADPLRDFKNSVHTMNDLFRKAVENNHVHPIYIHDYSSRFGYQIENAATYEDVVGLISKMVKKYCYLAKNYSLAMYSGTVRNAILYIHLNLCAPLSTKDIAASQNISPNYLSNQFKAEVKTTITDYIRDKRIEMAIKLLNTTELSIQDVANQVGIDDASYFSKQFKRQVGVSPLQYQKMIRQHTK